MLSSSLRAVLAAAFVASLMAPTVCAQAACVQLTAQQLIVYHAGSLSAAFTPIEQAFTHRSPSGWPGDLPGRWGLPE